jgi:hypothetical protein
MGQREMLQYTIPSGAAHYHLMPLEKRTGQCLVQGERYLFHAFA